MKPSRQLGFVFAVLLVLTVLQFGPTTAHSSTCDFGPVTGQIHLPTLTPGHGSVTEHVQFGLLQRTPLEDAAFEERNGADAYIHDMGCHSDDLTLWLEGESSKDLHELEVRFYDHFGFEIGDVPCGDTPLQGEPVPTPTQYVAVAACEGLPLDQDHLSALPYTVEIKLETV